MAAAAEAGVAASATASASMAQAATGTSGAAEFARIIDRYARSGREKDQVRRSTGAPDFLNG